MEKGYIQIYTGDGKGKTTAALGLALRACCAGKRVLMLQFLKGQPTSELRAPRWVPGLAIEQLGSGAFITGEPQSPDIALAQEGLARFSRELSCGAWDMVIADELCVAVSLGLLPVEEVLAALEARHPGTEAVLTGRNAPQELIQAADLVSEIREVQHYWQSGVAEREGIER